MKTKKELSLKIYKTKDGRYQIHLWYKNKRYRFANGSAIEENLMPNLLEEPERGNMAFLMCSAFQLAIAKGWRPTDKKKEAAEKKKRLSNIADVVLERKLKFNYSDYYRRDLIRTHANWNKYLRKEGLSNLLISDLSIDVIAKFVYEYAPSPESMKNVKRNISALLRDELETHGVFLNYKRIKLPRTTQQLHKPIKDVGKLLNDIKAFNDNLYLCALMTYALLLRPHREIRCLTVGDFNEDFSLLSLDGERVKSKKNRILPVPSFVQEELLERFQDCEDAVNLFSRRRRAYHRDYFKNRWADYKRETDLIEKNQTIYSFRHTGAIRVFEKTGSLQKLQQVMGHSDMKVSLTYLRGLEVKQLDVEDLPEL